MQRLEWHCHSKSVSGALYRTTLDHGQSAGKEMANSAVFNFRRKAGSDWISLEVGREFQARDAAARNARSPMVARRVGGRPMTSVDVEADRRRRRPTISHNRRLYMPIMVPSCHTHFSFIRISVKRHLSDLSQGKSAVWSFTLSRSVELNSWLI